MPLLDLTTTHYDLHHAEFGWNYGLDFTAWDRWMGIEDPDDLARIAVVSGHRLPAAGHTK